MAAVSSGVGKCNSLAGKLGWRVNLYQIERLYYPVWVVIWRISALRGRSAPAWPMTVEVSHHVETSEPDGDGFYDYHYEYDVYEFSDGVLTLLVRAYSDEPEKAALMGWNRGKTRYWLKKQDLHHPLVLEAAAYLRASGKSRLDWLDRVNRGYMPFD
ncbi:Hypothetical protein NGAL_HAMBI1146_43560 [Neorhizobium galegae bv. officinalis]|nr:Hypothetical protein NGAL_HAMBI1146_43560 [Neorhizobium galegae bv. officinalis]